MKRFSFIERNKYWQEIENQTYDLLIVGGGINGAGIARDAASRGMKVLVVESRDFAEGTSSRSSKLIHGGIRYLENGDFKLVFEALNERTKLFEIAPHLVHPLRFMIPLYEDSRVGMFTMGLGMWLYDALALFQAPEMHERLSAQESYERMPLLRRDKLKGSYVYSDAYMDDDRLVHETLRSAHEWGARAVNYVEATKVDFAEDGKISKVHLKNLLNGETKSVRAHHVVGSVGPWTDILGENFFPHWKKVLRPTKGIHLTLSKERLPLSSAVVMGAEKSDRIVFGIPRHEMVIIGTTDTDFQGDPGEVSTNSEDVKYLLHVAEQYFPGAQLKAEDIIATYAGVRPLVRDDSESEGKTSREHAIWSLHDRGITFVAGGKYTTYRLMAREVVDEVLHFFSFEDRVHFSRSLTEQPLISYASGELLRNSLALVGPMARNFDRPLSDVARLCERYGMEAEVILSGSSRHYSYWQIEAAQAIDHTMCLNLVDFYSRRVHLFLARADHGWPLVDEVAEVFIEKMGWDDKRVESEKAHLKTYIAQELSWQSQV